MMNLNISQAAKAAGVTRATIHKHIRTGKLSAIVEDDGRRVIDVAELERVYGQLVSPDTVHTNSKNMHLDTPEVTSILHSQIERLEREIDVLRQERTPRSGAVSGSAMSIVRNAINSTPLLRSRPSCCQGPRKKPHRRK
jgi:DNA-binding transcriptional MerR regulator